MEALTELFKLPITEGVTAIAAIAGAQKMGFDIIGVLKKFMKITDESDAILQAKMDKLQAHFNEETTQILTRIEESVKVLPDIRDHTRDTKAKLEEFERHGIPCATK